MTATYQIVHYLPDPSATIRVPVAAYVTDSTGRHSLATADHLPNVQCFRSTRQAALMQMVVARLERQGGAGQLPVGAGPHVVLSGMQKVPETVRDPVAWVKANILSRPHPKEKLKYVAREPELKVWGRRFLETFHLAQYVTDNFRPDFDWQPYARRHAVGFRHLAPITHWVRGQKAVLLMEPIAPARATFTRDLERITTTFVAYNAERARLHEEDAMQLLAYVLPGGTSARRAEIGATLDDRASVVDLASEAGRTLLADRVRRVAYGGGLFPH